MIRTEGKVIFNEKLFLKQIFRLEHIIDRNGELNSEAFFYSKGLDYLDVLKIRKIYEAIPYGLKMNIDSNEWDTDVSGDELTFIRN